MYVRKAHWLQCSESIRSRQQTGGRATSQEADAVVQMQGDSGCDTSLDSHYLQERSRHLSATVRGPPPLVAALWFSFGELPSVILLRSVVPDTLPSSGQAGPIRWVLPGFLTLGSGSWCCPSPSNASSTTSPSAELLTPYRQRKPLPPWSPKAPSSVHHSHLSVLLPFRSHQLGCS